MGGKENRFSLTHKLVREPINGEGVRVVGAQITTIKRFIGERTKLINEYSKNSKYSTVPQ